MHCPLTTVVLFSYNFFYIFILLKGSGSLDVFPTSRQLAAVCRLDLINSKEAD